MNNDNTRNPTPARTGAAKTVAAKTVAAQDTPLQPPEPPSESALQSIGNAISAPVRDAAESEERKQVGQPGQR